MNANQIRYWEVLEKRRSNMVMEQETNRSNVARETETYRHNVETERQNNLGLQETARHNRATEDIADKQYLETVRHNKAGESLGILTLAETQRANQAKEAETTRHNKEMETLGRDTLNESIRATNVKSADSRIGSYAHLTSSSNPLASAVGLAGLAGYELDPYNDSSKSSNLSLGSFLSYDPLEAIDKTLEPHTDEYGRTYYISLGGTKVYSSDTTIPEGSYLGKGKWR